MRFKLSYNFSLREKDIMLINKRKPSSRSKSRKLIPNTTFEDKDFNMITLLKGRFTSCNISPSKFLSDKNLDTNPSNDNENKKFLRKSRIKPMPSTMRIMVSKTEDVSKLALSKTPNHATKNLKLKTQNKKTNLEDFNSNTTQTKRSDISKSKNHIKNKLLAFTKSSKLFSPYSDDSRKEAINKKYHKLKKIHHKKNGTATKIVFSHRKIKTLTDIYGTLNV